jgi:hypothetical protein
MSSFNEFSGGEYRVDAKTLGAEDELNFGIRFLLVTFTK